VNAPSARLRLRVAPGARRSEIVGRYGDGWRVRVRAAPERGRANDELLTLLAGTLRVQRKALRLVAGASSRDKIVELEGVDAEEAGRRLAGRLPRVAAGEERA
jgi:uncharacterized protein YggU (UPF0235/DUF167 family)